MAEGLYWEAQTVREERLAVLLMKILGSGAKPNGGAVVQR
jgi:hypothetical protein